MSYTYNDLGQKATMTDRDGTVHTYGYDDQGNPTSDTVTTLGAGVDGTVIARDTAYSSLGQPILYSTIGGSGVTLSQVHETYDGFGNVTAEAQSHGGPVTGGTPTVGYGFTLSGSAKEVPTSLVYPNGRTLSFDYEGMAGNAGAITSISDTNFTGPSGNQILAGYSYLGGGDSIVTQTRPTGASESITLDNFGNVSDLNWTNAGNVSHRPLRLRVRCRRQRAVQAE